MTHSSEAEAAVVIGATQPARIARLGRSALWLAGFGVLIALAGFFMDRAELWRAYLFAWLFCLEIGLGGLGLVLLHHLAGGRWSKAARPIALAAAQTLPWLGLLFLPLLTALPTLYPWADSGQMAASQLLQSKSLWLNTPFLIGRSIVYLGVWSGLAYGLGRLTAEDVGRGQASLGMILYVLTTTFAAFDWMMSLEPAWFSSIYGLLFLAGQAVAGISLVILGLAAPLPQREGRGWGEAVQSFNDLGNLLLASVMIWAYFAFSQYLIIWSANIPEEAVWYIHRSGGGWQWVALGLIGLHFVLPFALLLSRGVKRNPRVLAWLAVLLLLARAVDLYWLLVPAFHPEGVYFHWLYPLLLAGMLGGWVALFLRQWSGVRLFGSRNS